MVSHGVKSQKTAFFIVTAVKTSNLTRYSLFSFVLAVTRSRDHQFCGCPLVTHRYSVEKEKK
jgi:hypothetical protein